MLKQCTIVLAEKENHRSTMAEWIVTVGAKQTWMPIPNHAEETYRYMLPVNLVLSVFILIHNSVILMDYYPDRRKFVTSMFMLIAACDMLTAFGCVLKAVPAALCLLNPEALFPYWLEGLHLPVSGISYIFSVFFTVVLSVTKTIKGGVLTRFCR